MIQNSKKEALKKRCDALGIFEEDIKETFIRSSGPGGQNVNKTSTCVRLLHLTSGIEIKCQKTRSQSLNRYYARILLCDEIEEKIILEKSEKIKKIEKIKRQKRKRSKRAKEKILKKKKEISEKKGLRKKISE